MSSVLRTTDYLKDAVVVASERRRSFTLTHLGGGEDLVPAQDDAVAQRAQLETAKQQAERIIAEAEQQADGVRLEATTRGYEEGFAQGLKAAEDECRTYLLEIAKMAENAAVDRETMIRSAQKELSALAIAIASKIIQREISTDRSVVLAVVESALHRVPIDTQVRILVNPEDLDLVQSHWVRLGGAVSMGCEAEIVGDEHVDRGGCMIESRGGAVDSRIETQLVRIADAFELDR